MPASTKGPAFPIDELKFLQGQAVTLDTIKDGGVLVLEFWATWCGPCRSTTPHLNQLAQKFKDRGVHVVGVSTDDAARGSGSLEQRFSAVTSFVRSMGANMQYPIAVDPTGSVWGAYASHYKVRGIPHAFVIGSDGAVLWHGHPMEPRMESVISSAAGPSRPAAPTPLPVPPREKLEKLSVRDLKKILASHSVSARGCLEKADLVARIVKECGGGGGASAAAAAPAKASL